MDGPPGSQKSHDQGNTAGTAGLVQRPESPYPPPTRAAHPHHTCSTSCSPLTGVLVHDQSRIASTHLLIFVVGGFEQRGRFLPDATQVVFTSVGEQSLSAASRANNLGG